MNNSEESASAGRVMDAIEFRRPDRLPRWDNFILEDSWSKQFVQRWQQWKGLSQDTQPSDHYDIDISVSMADEGPFFQRRGLVKREGDYEIYRGDWGNLTRQRPGAFFAEPIQNILDNATDLDRLEFDPVSDEDRYTQYVQNVESERKAGRLSFTKIGGIYCRSQFMRREDRLLI